YRGHLAHASVAFAPLRIRRIEVSDGCSMTQERPHFGSRGSVLALDLGEKLVGAAISDDQQITIKRLAPLRRSNWKRLLSEVETLIESFYAQTLLIGLPLRLFGT